MLLRDERTKKKALDNFYSWFLCIVYTAVKLNLHRGNFPMDKCLLFIMPGTKKKRGSWYSLKRSAGRGVQIIFLMSLFLSFLTNYAEGQDYPTFVCEWVPTKTFHSRLAILCFAVRLEKRVKVVRKERLSWCYLSEHGRNDYGNRGAEFKCGDLSAVWLEINF